jgi:uncharacterized membrane protein
MAMQSRSQRGLWIFFKSTVVGGIFVLVPVVLLSIVIGQAAQLAYQVVHPVVEWLPQKTISTVSLAFLISIVALVLICFGAGLVARTAVSRWFVGSLERLILSFVPSYGLMKSMGQGWVGVDADEPHQPVLVQLDDCAHIGFVMDTFKDGRQVVFVPDVPNPWSGTLMLITPDRIEPLPFTTRQTIDCLRHLGVNTSELLAEAARQG